MGAGRAAVVGAAVAGRAGAGGVTDGAAGFGWGRCTCRCCGSGARGRGAGALSVPARPSLAAGAAPGSAGAGGAGAPCASRRTGFITIIIERPSSSGMRSTIPWSLRRSATCRRRTRPRSGCASSRPRKRTVTLSLSPSSRNFAADLILVSMSWSSIFGVIRGFFPGHGALALLRFLRLLLLGIAVLAEVEDAGDRRRRVRRR